MNLRENDQIKVLGQEITLTHKPGNEILINETQLIKTKLYTPEPRKRDNHSHREDQTKFYRYTIQSGRDRYIILVPNGYSLPKNTLFRVKFHKECSDRSLFGNWDGWFFLTDDGFQFMSHSGSDDPFSLEFSAQYTSEKYWSSANYVYTRFIDNQYDLVARKKHFAKERELANT